MKKKKLTKQQKEDIELAALVVRITDMYSGASGGSWSEEEEWPTAEQLSIIAPSVRSIFQCDDVPDFIWDLRNLDKFEKPSIIAENLFRFGVRA